ncbi:MAG: hypothetical protein ACOY9J_00700 [Pseudomonadota bacterium]
MNNRNIVSQFGAALVISLALVNGGCGKQESSATAPAVSGTPGSDLSQVGATSAVDTSVAEPAIACLMTAYGNGLGDVLKPELRANAPANIPKDQLVVWSSQENIFAAECGVATGDAVTKALQEAPYVVVNEAAKRHLKQQSTYTPPPKGEFEKTADYDQRIAAERTAFEASNKNRPLGAKDLEVAWSATFGSPSIYEGHAQNDPDDYKYDADHELLTFLISSRAASIPITINMSTANMQALDTAVSEGMFGNPTIADLGLNVYMQYANGKLTIKAIGFIPGNDVIRERLNALPYNVSAIPVDQEIFFTFGK